MTTSIKALQENLFRTGLIPAWQLNRLIHTCGALQESAPLNRTLRHSAEKFADRLNLMAAWAVHPATTEEELTQAQGLLESTVRTLAASAVKHSGLRQLQQLDFSDKLNPPRAGRTGLAKPLLSKTHLKALPVPSFSVLQAAYAGLNIHIEHLLKYNPTQRHAWIEFHLRTLHPFLAKRRLNFWTTFARRSSLEHALQPLQSHIPFSVREVYLNVPYLPEAEARNQWLWEAAFRVNDSADSAEPASSKTAKSFRDEAATEPAYVLPMWVTVSSNSKGHLRVSAKFEYAKFLSIEQLKQVNQLTNCGREGQDLKAELTTAAECHWRTSPAELAQTIEMAEKWQAAIKDQLPELLSRMHQMLENRKREELLKRFTKDFNPSERDLLLQMLQQTASPAVQADNA